MKFVSKRKRLNKWATTTTTTKGANKLFNVEEPVPSAL